MIMKRFMKKSSRFCFRRILALIALLIAFFPCTCQAAPPRRVLFIMGNLGIGGTEQAFISLINLWAVPNTQVEIYLKNRCGVLEQFLRTDFPIITQKDAFFRSYDVAACFYGWGANPQTELGKTHAKRKIQWIHTDLLQCPVGSFFNHKEMCEGIDAFICVGQKPAASARKIQPQLSNKIFAIPNVLDQAAIKKKAQLENPHYPQDGLCNVVSVGRLSGEKGYDRLIRVHSRLDREGLFFRLYIVGDGALRISLQRQIHEAGLDSKIFLVGEKSNPYPWIAKADLFALPSLFEGCSVAVNEAKILARPILMTDVGAAREQITSEINGLIVDNNEEAIYQGLKRLVKDKNLRKQFSAALKGFVYDNTSIYNQIEQVFFQTP